MVYLPLAVVVVAVVEVGAATVAVTV